MKDTFSVLAASLCLLPATAGAACPVSLKSTSIINADLVIYEVDVNGDVEDIEVHDIGTGFVVSVRPTTSGSGTQWLTGEVTTPGSDLELTSDLDGPPDLALLYGKTNNTPATTWSVEEPSDLQGNEHVLAALSYAIEDHFGTAQADQMGADIRGWIDTEGCTP